MPPRERELVDYRVEIPSPSRSSGGVRNPSLRSKSIGAKAIGALAVGAVAIGALAIGALAIGGLVVGRARIRRIEIDDLVVRRLHITEKLHGPNKSDTER